MDEFALALIFILGNTVRYMAAEALLHNALVRTP
jgi:hypothetical protein